MITPQDIPELPACLAFVEENPEGVEGGPEIIQIIKAVLSLIRATENDERKNEERREKQKQWKGKGKNRRRNNERMCDKEMRYEEEGPV